MKLDDALFGRVVSIQQGSNIDTVTLQIGGTGSRVVGVEHLNSYDPHVNDQVYYHVVHGVPWVIGVMGSFVPYPIVPPATPTPPAIQTATYLAMQPGGSGVHHATIYGFTSGGVLHHSVDTGLTVAVPGGFAGSPPNRWAHMSYDRSFIAVLGRGGAGPGQVNVYSLPGLYPVGSPIVIAGTGTQVNSSSVCWDPAARILYVYSVGDDTLTGYTPAGAIAVGPVTVSATLPGYLIPTLSATADGYLWLVTDSGGSTTQAAAWQSGTLTPMGVSSVLTGDPMSFVGMGDGTYDVLAGGSPHEFAPGSPIYTLDPLTLADTLIDASDDGQQSMAAVIDGILYQIGNLWDIGGASSLPALPLIPGGTPLAISMTADGSAGVALGWTTRPVMQAFLPDGSVGDLVDIPDGPENDNATFIWMVSWYSAPMQGTRYV
jgi:hypothetical protein